MSRIYFHTPERTVEVRGSERAYMGVLAADMAIAVLRVRLYGPDGREWARSITVAERDVFHREEWWRQDWETWFRVGWNDHGLRVGGAEIGATDLALNTLIATRSPALTFMAKLHGTCEDHAWIAPGNAEWFAEIIDQGRAENVLRPDQGWEAVAELAREVASGTAGPIVTSYSVTDGFPNRYVIGEPWFYPWQKGPDGEYLPNEPDEEATERWDALSERERWDLAVPAIKAREYNREIAPDSMAQGFMSGHSAFDLAEPLATEGRDVIRPSSDERQP